MRNEQTTNGFDFEEFTGMPRTTRGLLCVSIYMPGGDLFLNAKTTADLGHPESVILFFDRHKMVIGVRPTSNPVPHAVRLRRITAREHRVRISHFLTLNEIDLGYSIRFLEPYIEDDGTLILDLNRTKRVIGSRTIARERAEALVKAKK